MPLADHLGEVIRKAREAASVEAETAAEFAGVGLAEFQTFERTGHNEAPIPLDDLAGLIGLHPDKLKRLAGGWHPATPDLGHWRELRVITTEENGLAVNCFLVWDEVTREAAIFDTGWDAEPILRLIDDNNLEPKHLFLTHSHEDHMAAIRPLRERFSKLHLHTSSKAAPPQHRNRHNDFIHLSNLRITSRESPGHSEDGVCYVVGNWPEDAPHAVMVGDTLFAGSVATGWQSHNLLKQKIQEQILSLPPATLICPGHGPLTTVAEEQANNPFFLS